jgi:hypothetical protein
MKKDQAGGNVIIDALHDKLPMSRRQLMGTALAGMAASALSGPMALAQSPQESRRPADRRRHHERDAWRMAA